MNGPVAGLRNHPFKRFHVDFNMRRGGNAPCGRLYKLLMRLSILKGLISSKDEREKLLEMYNSFDGVAGPAKWLVWFNGLETHALHPTVHKLIF